MIIKYNNVPCLVLENYGRYKQFFRVIYGNKEIRLFKCSDNGFIEIPSPEWFKNFYKLNKTTIT